MLSPDLDGKAGDMHALQEDGPEYAKLREPEILGQILEGHECQDRECGLGQGVRGTTAGLGAKQR